MSDQRLTAAARRCIGFGEFDGKCDRAAGSTHSKLWRQRCDDLRLASLDGQFEKLATDVRRALEHHRSEG